jgi:4-amino-4-deoxy-L-arabinose transferase-like glycosyltransferase
MMNQLIRQNAFRVRVVAAYNHRRGIYLILLLALVLSLVEYKGVRGGDDLCYVTHAREMALGTYQVTAHPFWNRVGLLFPEAALYHWFGPRAFPLTFYPLLMGLGLVYLTYLLGRLATGKEPPALLAAALVATLPCAVEQSTSILSDLPSAFFITLSLLLTLYSSEWTGRRRRWGLFFAGLSLGWAYLCKEQAVIILPVFLVLFFREVKRDRRRVWTWSALALGGMIFPVLEALFYYSAVGDPFFRYTGVDTSHNVTPWYVREVIANGELGKRLTLDLLNRMVTRYREFGVFFPLAGAGTVWAIFAPEVRARLLAVWLWLFLLSFNFISTSVTEYLPLLVVSRYLLPAVPPAAVLVAGLFIGMGDDLRQGSVSGPVWKGAWALLLVAVFAAIYQSILFQFLFVAFSALIVWPLLRLRSGKDPGPGWRRAPAVLLSFQLLMIVFVFLTPHPVRPFSRLDARVLRETREDPDLPIYTDPHSVAMLTFLDGYRRPERFVDFYTLKNQAPTRGYLWRQDHFIGLINRDNITSPSFVSSPAPGWRVIFKKSYQDEKYILYRLDPPAP